MLKDLFIIESLTRESDSSLSATVCLNPHSSVFLGHFPGTPVLPGVCSIYLVKDCLQRHLGLKLKYLKIDLCKFTGMVCPREGEKIYMRILWDHHEDTKQVKARMQYGSNTVLKLQAVINEA